jgi:transposase-like protein
MERISIIDLVEQIPTEADAYAFMERLRWPDKPICPHCASEADHRFLAPENGSSRRTRTGTLSQRRVWKCRDCKRQFSVITNTPFHGSKVPLRTWLFVLFEMCANKNGIAAREIARKYRLTNKTAWFVAHRVRLAMENLPVAAPMRGVIVSDETWIGGDAKNRHESDRNRHPHDQGHYTEKTPVVALINAETGEARSAVLTNVDSTTLRKAMVNAQVDMDDSVLWTDEYRGYTYLGRRFLTHETVNHSKGQYVNRRGAGTNLAENFFSQFKRSLDGTHHHVSREHLPKYVTEFDFRYSTRRLSDTQRMQRLMGQTANRRLSYKRVKGGC